MESLRNKSLASLRRPLHAMETLASHMLWLHGNNPDYDKQSIGKRPHICVKTEQVYTKP
jgi:hypothetical protein